MTELAADSILAKAFTCRVRFAEGHTILAGNMCLFVELVVAVSKGTFVSKFAVLALEPEFANFGLFFLFVCRLEILGSRHVHNWPVLHEWQEFGVGGLENRRRGL